mmetsp:Transcript_19616/g.21303  ORF Transcript_19616/g.21303 Transcript_19616/m.21303 type:complete len:355 (+) Transcript_19616:30-1094(+)
MKAKSANKKSSRQYNLSSPYEKAIRHDTSEKFEDQASLQSDESDVEDEELPNLENDEEEYVYNDEYDSGGHVEFSLADIIMQKLKEKELMDKQGSGEAALSGTSLSPKIIEVYSAIGDLLSKYRSGKLPKAVKVLPHLKNWEEILAITNPVTWSPAGTYAITKVFASNLNAKLVQRFYNLVLLEKCRSDVDEHGKLNFHLYHALKKALFKPSAFYKGIVLPLLYSDTCTQREAVIFASVLAKVSIPAIHSAAVIMKILELPYSIPICIFLKQILLKKYAFPARVIDAISSYFSHFKQSTEDYPVVWHQTLLTFVQRYKFQLQESQREGLLQLIHFHSHHEISPEIRRELSCSQV